MRIIDCEQLTPEWFAARKGIPTASEFGSIITPAKMQYAAAASGYINRLIDEHVRPDAERSWNGNRHTERGRALEPEAREVYAFEHDVSLRQVGLVLNADGTLGCSPDSLVLGVYGTATETTAGFEIGDDILQIERGLEVKCPDGPTHVEWLRAGGLPAEYKAQVHGSLVVTGLASWDFWSYCPPYPCLHVRVVPDTFTKALAECVQRFLGEYHAARDSILGMMR